MPQFVPRRHRSQDILASVGKTYPRAWSQVDQFRALRGKDDIPAWPSWCYLPLHGAYAIVSGGGPNRVPLERSHHIGIVGALAAWRVSQGVYRYDADLARALDDTPPPVDLPAAALYRLPEWCVYIETPGLTAIDGRPLAGYWAHLEWDERGADELRLLLDIDGPLEADWSTLVPVPLILGHGSIADALARVAASGAMQATAAGYRVSPASVDTPTVVARLWPLLSRLLYLCAEEPDLGGRVPQRPEAVRTKAGWRLFPASALTRWDVGVRIGTALRLAQQRADQEAHTAGGHARPRPHMRRAHFHGFWTGPKDQPGQRALRLRWLPPIPVNVEDAADLPVTLHDAARPHGD